MVHDSFSTGSTVYTHLCGPTGKHLLHAAKMQPGLAKLPSNNAEKRQLLDTLVTLINSNQHSAYLMPVPAAKPEASASENPSTAAADRPSTPETDDAPPVSTMLPRKLVFDGKGIDLAQLMRVYLDGFNRFPPFIRFFCVPDKYDPLPEQFRPETEKAPGWEDKNSGKQWADRRDAVYEVCKQAYWLQQTVTARALEYGSKKKLKTRGVGIDLRTAVRKVTSLLQTALDANKKAGQHPQSLPTLSTMFKHLLEGKAEPEVTRSSAVPEVDRKRPASSLQRWLCIASSSDVDAIVAELYA